MVQGSRAATNLASKNSPGILLCACFCAEYSQASLWTFECLSQCLISVFDIQWHVILMFDTWYAAVSK